MIDFDHMQDLKFEDIEFKVIDTSEMEAPPSTGFNKYLKRPEYNGESCRQLLMDFIGVDPKADFHFHLIINFDRGTQEHIAFNYLKDRCIEAYEFKGSKNFLLLLDVLLGSFSGDNSTLVRYSSEGGSRSNANIDLLINAPAKHIESYAPRIYFDRQLREEKLAFLDFHKSKSMDQSVDLNKTAVLWQKILEASGSRRIAASPKQFKEFANTTGFPFPEELKAVYEISDGAENSIFGRDLLPMERVISSWKLRKEIFDDWPLDELLADTACDEGYTIGIYVCPFRVPMVEEAGISIAMDLMPGPDGKVGQVVDCSRDSDAIVLKNKNINQFLARCLEHLQNDVNS